MNPAETVIVEMTAGLVRWLVRAESLERKECGHDAAETAALAAVGTEAGHWFYLVIAEGQNDEALPKASAGN
jgi:hypothetical protein